MVKPKAKSINSSVLKGRCMDELSLIYCASACGSVGKLSRKVRQSPRVGRHVLKGETSPLSVLIWRSAIRISDIFRGPLLLYKERGYPGSVFLHPQGLEGVWRRSDDACNHSTRNAHRPNTCLLDHQGGDTAASLVQS